jgi:folate-dependent phosphoribosylglycinamide formyltransferase PurN
LELAAGTLHVGHAALAGKFVGSVLHLHPGLWVAMRGLAVEEGAVAAIEDIDFRV